MRSTFGGIEISKRSLFSNQAALTTTGHNIANANTRGYSRQVVNLVASRPIEVPGLMRSNIPGQMGQGVEFDYIKRIREGFLDRQYHNEYKSLGQWTVRRDSLEKLEAIINEPSDTGIRQVLDNFWNSWQELSKQPDNLETRAVVKESALALTDAFNHAAKQLKDLNADLTDNINVKIKEVNSILEQVHNLNSEIFRIEGLGNDANDLRDQRDVLMDDLSKIINITVSEQDGGYTVRMGNVELVNGNNFTRFTQDTVDSNFQIDGNGNLNDGELFGIRFARDKLVEDYQDQLDSMVNTIFTNVNAVHKTGYIQQDNPVKLGGDFFTFLSSDPNQTRPAEQLRLSSDIINNVENIAASKRTYVDASGIQRVVRGNNELALEIANMRNNKYSFTSGVLTGGTFDEYIRAIVSEIGVQTQEAKRQATNQQILVDQVESRRQSVSGVSLDEEMANMIKYQHAYNAAARSLTTFDEMLDKVINGMGTVGR